MNKFAAEKIAQEYYNLGMELALSQSGMSKTASKKGFLAGLVGGIGGLGAVKGGEKAYQAYLARLAEMAEQQAVTKSTMEALNSGALANMASGGTFGHLTPNISPRLFADKMLANRHAAMFDRVNAASAQRAADELAAQASHAESFMPQGGGLIEGLLAR